MDHPRSWGLWRSLLRFNLIILYVAVLAALLTIIFAIYNGVGTVPTSTDVKLELFKHLPQHFPGPIIELGSGFGTLLIPLAKKYPLNKIISYENSPIPFLITYLRTRKYKNVILSCKNFTQTPLPENSLIICYLYPGAMAKLEEKLPTHCLFITHTFALPTTPPTHTFTAPDLYKTKIYFYNF